MRANKSVCLYKKEIHKRAHLCCHCNIFFVIVLPSHSLSACSGTKNALHTGFERLLCQLFTGNVFLGNVVLSLFHQSFRPVKERHIPEFSVGEFPCGWPLFANKNPIMNEDSLCNFSTVPKPTVLQLDIICYAILLIKNKSFRLECIPCLHAQRVLYSSIHLCC